MKSLRYILIIIALAASVVIHQSCNSAGCSENRNAVPLAQFLNSSDDKAIVLDSLSISGVDAPGDTILSKAGKGVSEVYLPMRPTKNNVKWCIAYKWKALDYQELNDTIAIDYKSIPVFVSDECGAYYQYEITKLTTTHHLIDSVTVIDSLVTNVDKAYINIYFRVSDSE